MCIVRRQGKAGLQGCNGPVIITRLDINVSGRRPVGKKRGVSQFMTMDRVNDVPEKRVLDPGNQVTIA
jgi:hypothetical protein